MIIYGSARGPCWEPIALFFNRLGLNPNTMTILGLVGNAIGAVLIARGNMFWGGVLILAMAPVDALDGTMARLRGQPTKFGAFVDSVTDRYSELVIFGGLLVYYQQLNKGLEMLIVYAAAAGSVLVSYVRARGQSLGYDTKVGLFSRLERFLVLTPIVNPQYSYGWGGIDCRFRQYHCHPTHPGCAPPGAAGYAKTIAGRYSHEIWANRHHHRGCGDLRLLRHHHHLWRAV